MKTVASHHDHHCPGLRQGWYDECLLSIETDNEDLSCQATEVHPLSPLKLAEYIQENAAACEAPFAVGSAHNPPTEYEAWGFEDLWDIFPDTNELQEASHSENANQTSFGESASPRQHDPCDKALAGATSDEVSPNGSPGKTSPNVSEAPPDKDAFSEDVSLAKSAPQYEDGLLGVSRCKSPLNNHSIPSEDFDESSASKISQTHTGLGMRPRTSPPPASLLSSPDLASPEVSSPSKKRRHLDDSLPETSTKRFKDDGGRFPQRPDPTAWSKVRVRLYKLTLGHNTVVTWNRRRARWQYEGLWCENLDLKEHIEPWQEMSAAQVRPLGNCGYDLWLVYNERSGMFEGFGHMNGKWLRVDCFTMFLLVKEPDNSQEVE